MRRDLSLRRILPQTRLLTATQRNGARPSNPSPVVSSRADEEAKPDAGCSAGRERRNQRRPRLKDSSFPGTPNDGNLRQILTTPRFSTAGLHRPNPVAREMPGFIGFFVRRGQVAEREGFSARAPGGSKTAVNSAFPDNRGGLCVPAVCTGTGDPAQADSSGW
jgi:hypothetical protein